MNRLKRKSAQNYERLSAFQTSPIHTWFKLPSLRNSRPSCDEGSMHSLNSAKYLPQMKEPDNATDLTIRQITLHGCNDFGWSLRLDRDDFSSNRHPDLSFCLSMISAQTRSAFVARENRYPPSGRGPRACFSGSCSIRDRSARPQVNPSRRHRRRSPRLERSKHRRRRETTPSWQLRRLRRAARAEWCGKFACPEQRMLRPWEPHRSRSASLLRRAQPH